MSRALLANAFDLEQPGAEQHVDDVVVEAVCVGVDPEGGVQGDDPRQRSGISAFIEQNVATVVPWPGARTFHRASLAHGVPDGLPGEPQLRARGPRNAMGEIEVALADWTEEQHLRQRFITLRMRVDQLRIHQ